MSDKLKFYKILYCISILVLKSSKFVILFLKRRMEAY